LFLRISELSSPNFWATVFHGKMYLLVLTKNSLATFWAIFSQTHRVTLIEGASNSLTQNVTQNVGQSDDIYLGGRLFYSFLERILRS
jgi:hypothetical protein